MARGFEPIIPKKKKLIDAAKVESNVKHEMSSLLSDVHREMSEYEAPPPDPMVYIRTDTLKKSWSKKGPYSDGRSLIGIVGTALSYAIFVRGPKRGLKGHRQARRMAARGWRSVTEIADRIWPSYRRRFIRIIQQS